MTVGHDLIERGIPDLIGTERLPPVVAAEIDFLGGRVERWTSHGGPMVRARAWVCSGVEDEAMALLAANDVADGVHELVAASWAVARIGTPEMAERCLRALAAQAPFLTADGAPLGPRALAEGPLLAAYGDLPGATFRLERAVAEGDARAPLWGALARVELARVRRCAEAVGTDTDAGLTVDQLLNAATLFFRAGGHRALLARTEALTRPDRRSPVLGAPSVGRLRPGPTWRVGFGVMGDVTMRPGKGLLLIRHLVQQPGRPVPAVVLDRLADGDDSALAAVAELRPDDADLPSTEEIRARLLDETVRSRVGKLLSRTTDRLEDAHPLLGRHLRATLRTGHSCRYDAPTAPVVVWRV